jgi:hypothetical protein
MKQKGTKLIIFDDLVGKREFEPVINDWFVRGRKAGTSMVFITQSFYKTDPLIRRSLSNLYLFPSSNKRELQMVLSEYAFLQEDYPDELEEFRHIVKGQGPSDFLNVNIQKQTACINFELYD